MKEWTVWKKSTVDWVCSQTVRAENEGDAIAAADELGEWDWEEASTDYGAEVEDDGSEEKGPTATE